MKLVTLDFETYFDSDYTLSKMTTEEYIRDPRFKVHMCGVYPAERAGCIYTNSTTIAFLEQYADDAAFICHHAHFDGLILSHHYGIRPAFWLDTLSMARLVFPHAKSHSLGSLATMLGIGKKDMPYNDFRGVRDLPPELYSRVAAGCATDVELTYQIFTKMLPYVPKDELRIIDMTVRMFTEPTLRLDRARMEWYSAALAKKKGDLLTRLGVSAKQLGSNDTFAQLLEALGEEPEFKAGKNGPIFAFAKNDEYMRTLLASDTEELALLAEARIDTKSTGSQSRAQRLLNMDTRGPLCVYINYAGAHTLRDSGGDSVNFQNMKRIDFDEKGAPLEGLDQRGHIRLSILAPEGYQIVVADSSQIECRLLNWMAGQQDVLDKFANKVDIYSELASMFYGREITKRDKAERGTGKQLELSCGYGAGAATIVVTAKLGIYGPPVQLTEEQGKAARDLYRATHPQVKALWSYAGKIILPALLAANADFTWGPLRVFGSRLYGPDGTWLDYSNLRYGTYFEGQEKPEYFTVSRHGGMKKMYGAKLVENVIQYLARALVMANAVTIGAKYRTVLRTHDEIVYLAPTAEATEALEFGLRTMKTPPAWCSGIPLDAEGGFAERYSK
jgi:DNA polymerase family A